MVGVLANLPGRESRRLASKQVEIEQEGDLLQVATFTRGLSVEESGYGGSGELRLSDDEILMGSSTANDDRITPKGTLYFVLHPHGLNMSGRWVGLGYDGRMMTDGRPWAGPRKDRKAPWPRLISSGGSTLRR